MRKGLTFTQHGTITTETPNNKVGNLCKYQLK